jgi:hypothetical protein
MTEPNEYLGSLDPDEFQAEEDFLNNHWANDMLDAPHALIAVIETKIARAVIAERKRIVDLIRAKYSNPEFNELGSFEFTDDIIDLIMEQND